MSRDDPKDTRWFPSLGRPRIGRPSLGQVQPSGRIVSRNNVRRALETLGTLGVAAGTTRLLRIVAKLVRGGMQR